MVTLHFKMQQGHSWTSWPKALKAPSNLRPQGTRTSLQVYTPALTMLDAHSKSQYHNVYIRIKVFAHFCHRELVFEHS